jgi:hypothetical protein
MNLIKNLIAKLWIIKLRSLFRPAGWIM